MIGCIC